MARRFSAGAVEPLTTMAMAISREAAAAYPHGDPFSLKGMITARHIRERANMFAA
jgi:hypothetical protein